MWKADESLRNSEDPVYTFADTEEGRALRQQAFSPQERRSGVNNVNGGRQYVTANKTGALGDYTYGQNPDEGYEYVYDQYNYDTVSGGAGVFQALAEAVDAAENIRIYDRQRVDPASRQRDRRLRNEKANPRGGAVKKIMQNLPDPSSLL